MIQKCRASGTFYMEKLALFVSEFWEILGDRVGGTHFCLWPDSEDIIDPSRPPSPHLTEFPKKSPMTNNMIDMNAMIGDEWHDLVVVKISSFIMSAMLKKMFKNRPAYFRMFDIRCDKKC
jgi:hypothetical protein